MARFLFLIIGIFFAFPVRSHIEESGPILSEVISKTSVSVVAVGGFLILFLIFIAAAKKEKSEIFKGVVFVLIAVTALAVTFYLSASTVYLNLISETGGPVHWHADFRIFNCGQEVFLQKPRGLSNRIGTPDLHEHADGRIHIEGVAVKKEHFTLHRFFEVIGGSLDYGEMTFPGEDNFERMKDGNKCPDDTRGKLQVFLYKTEGKIIRQTKLENFPEYVPAPYSQVPPGDCLIFEFTPEIKEKTDKICNFTDIAIRNGDYTYEK